MAQEYSVGRRWDENGNRHHYGEGERHDIRPFEVADYRPAILKMALHRASGGLHAGPDLMGTSAYRAYALAEVPFCMQ